MNDGSVQMSLRSRMNTLKLVGCVLAFCLAVTAVSPAQVFRSLVNFNGSQGAGALSSLIQGSDGNFYGTTLSGGSSNCTYYYNGCGVIFRMTPAGVYQPIYTFCQTSPCTDGSLPAGSLVQASDGNFYGTTSQGGDTTGSCQNYGCGTVFKITPEGVLTTLYTFCEQDLCPDGYRPFAGLAIGPDGNLYGTTSGGGSQFQGTVFRITPGGSLTTLHGFSGTDGNDPAATLLLASDGNFYGTTSGGGANDGRGTIFRISLSGQFTSLVTFCGQTIGPCVYGYAINAPLMQGADGQLYGTAYEGGDGGCLNLDAPCGTVFKITLDGNLTLVHTFDGYDGASPQAGLVEGLDGNYYGATTGGGSYTNCYPYGCGTIFRMTPAGDVTVLHAFLNIDGSAPASAVLSAADGNLYGTTYEGGSSSLGTLFSVSTSPTQYPLTVSVSANGTVTSTDGLINCPGNCSHSYNSGLQVTLNANPAPGYSLSAWTGACTGRDTCAVTMNQAQSVQATFVQNSYTLTASISGQGTIASTDGVITCPGSCSHTYLSLTPVTLNAAPASGWSFAGWSGACTGTGSCQLTMLGNYGVSAYFYQPGSGLQFVPITPCRLVDTRSSGGPVQGGTYRTFDLPSLAQTNGCADLSTAAVYSLNVTLVPQNHLPVSYLTIWAAGLAQPITSTMNSSDGRVKANAAHGSGRRQRSVNVYVTNTTNVILDIDGYFTAPSQSTLKFYPLAPCRVADTRSTNYPQGLGTPNLSGGVNRDFPVLTSSCIPSGVTPAAYSLNFTAIPYPQQGSRLGYLEIWPTGQQPQNPVSTLNNPTGTNVANAAIVPAGTGGSITALASDDTNLAVDINGYFASSGSGGLALYPAPPCRVFDSRGVGSGQPFSGTLSPPIDVVHSPCSVPSAAQAYVFNATVIPSPTLPYLTLWPDGEPQPNVSTLNAGDGRVTSNMAVVPNHGDGKVDAFAQGTTQLILDISSYFAP